MKQILINILEYLLTQLREDKCTADEIKSIHDAILPTLRVDVTVSDIARFYGQSETNVRSAISRRPSKPKRRVFYDFSWFDKIKPNSWKHTITEITE